MKSYLIVILFTFSTLCFSQLELDMNFVSEINTDEFDCSLRFNTMETVIKDGRYRNQEFIKSLSSRNDKFLFNLVLDYIKSNNKTPTNALKEFIQACKNIKNLNKTNIEPDVHLTNTYRERIKRYNEVQDEAKCIGNQYFSILNDNEFNDCNEAKAVFGENDPLGKILSSINQGVGEISASSFENVDDILLSPHYCRDCIEDKIKWNQQLYSIEPDKDPEEIKNLVKEELVNLKVEASFLEYSSYLEDVIKMRNLYKNEEKAEGFSDEMMLDLSCHVEVEATLKKCNKSSSIDPLRKGLARILDGVVPSESKDLSMALYKRIDKRGEEDNPCMSIEKTQLRDERAIVDVIELFNILDKKQLLKIDLDLGMTSRDLVNALVEKAYPDDALKNDEQKQGVKKHLLLVLKDIPEFGYILRNKDEIKSIFTYRQNNFFYAFSKRFFNNLENTPPKFLIDNKEKVCVELKKNLESALCNDDNFFSKFSVSDVALASSRAFKKDNNKGNFLNYMKATCGINFVAKSPSEGRESGQTISVFPNEYLKLPSEFAKSYGDDKAKSFDQVQIYKSMCEKFKGDESYFDLSFLARKKFSLKDELNFTNEELSSCAGHNQSAQKHIIEAQNEASLINERSKGNEPSTSDSNEKQIKEEAKVNQEKKTKKEKDSSSKSSKNEKIKVPSGPEDEKHKDAAPNKNGIIDNNSQHEFSKQTNFTDYYSKVQTNSNVKSFVNHLSQSNMPPETVKTIEKIIEKLPEEKKQEVFNTPNIDESWKKLFEDLEVKNKELEKEIADLKKSKAVIKSAKKDIEEPKDGSKGVASSAVRALTKESNSFSSSEPLGNRKLVPQDLLNKVNPSMNNQVPPSPSNTPIAPSLTLTRSDLFSNLKMLQASKNIPEELKLEIKGIDGKAKTISLASLTEEQWNKLSPKEQEEVLKLLDKNVEKTIEELLKEQKEIVGVLNFRDKKEYSLLDLDKKLE